VFDDKSKYAVTYLWAFGCEDVITFMMSFLGAVLPEFIPSELASAMAFELICTEDGQLFNTPDFTL
jgi:hypothetical protein